MALVGEIPRELPPPTKVPNTLNSPTAVQGLFLFCASLKARNQIYRLATELKRTCCSMVVLGKAPEATIVHWLKIGGMVGGVPEFVAT